MSDTNPFEGLSDRSAYVIRSKSVALASQSGFSASDIDDIEADLALHLRQQLSKYDASLGKMSTFRDRVLKRKVIRMIEERRTRHYHYGATSLETLYDSDDTNSDAEVAECSALAGAEDEIDPFHLVLLRADLQETMKSLTPQQVQLCQLLAEGSNITRCASAMGLSRDCVNDLRNQIRHTFRRLGLQAHLE